MRVVYKISLRGVFSGGSDGKESTCNVGDVGSIPGWGDPLEKGMAIHSSSLAWRILGQRSLAGPSLWGRKELEMTERLSLTPGGPVVKTLCFHCRGLGSIPGQGTKLLHGVSASKM